MSESTSTIGLVNPGIFGSLYGPLPNINGGITPLIGVITTGPFTGNIHIPIYN